MDYGQNGIPKNPCGDPPGGSGGTQTAPTAEGGALRSQDLRTTADPTGLDGTIIRVDPATGAALPSNPMAGSSDPNTRRIIAYGLRNPFRFTTRPGTNELWMGDVGWSDWEEIDRIGSTSDSTVENFGWPCYEGPSKQAGWDAAGLNLCTSLSAGAVTSPYYSYNHANKVAGESCASGSSSDLGRHLRIEQRVSGRVQRCALLRRLLQGLHLGDEEERGPGPLAGEHRAHRRRRSGTGRASSSALTATCTTPISTAGTVRRIEPTTPPPPGSSYLSDLTWTSMTNGYGPVEKDKSNGESGTGDGNTITLNGSTYSKGLGAHAASDVRYALSSGCTRFKSDVGVDDEVPTTGGSVVFQVYADATKVYDSGTMTGATATKSVDVSIAGATQLRLVVTNAGDNNTADHADWAIARIECGGGGDTTPPTITARTPASGATGVAVDVSPTATFSEAMSPASLTTSTFTLVQQGQSTPLAASVTYSGQTATLDPSANLAANTSYTATVKGGTAGAKDLAGNPLAADASWTFQTGGGTSSSTYLSDLTWTSMTNGYGPVEKDESNGEDSAGDGNTLTLNGTTYTKGLGAHAASDVRYALTSTCTRFKASVGVDDEVPTTGGSVVLQVYADATKVYDSGTMTGATATKSVDVSIAGATQLRLVVTNAGDNNTADHADWALARIECGGGGGGNQAPTPVIDTPASSLTWKVGDPIAFTGHATDPEQGTLPASALSWELVIQHCPSTCHSHSIQTWPGVASGSFAAPDHDYPSYLELKLTATDSGGAIATTTRRLDPKTVQLTFASTPTGLQLAVGSSTAATPFTRTVIVGSLTSMSAVTPQSLGGTTYAFASWSDGGAQSHNITAPATATTYTATYTVQSGPPPSGTYLSDLTWTSMTNGYGPVEKDKSNGESGTGDGNTITLNGSTYSKGLGAHAASDVRYALSSGCTRFKSDVGVDDEVPTTGGSVVFQVYADATKVYDSGTMTGATATKSVDVSIAGATQLRLVVTNAGDDNTADHADWAIARIECGGGGDTTPPTITARTPASGATGVAVDVSPTATFSEAMSPASLTTSTFTLVQQGQSTPLAASVTYSGQTATPRPEREPRREHELHGDGQGRNRGSQGPRRKPARRRRQLDLPDGRRHLLVHLPERPHLDVDDQRLRPGREGRVERRGQRG